MKWICWGAVCELHFLAVERNDRWPPSHLPSSATAFIHVSVPSTLLLPLKHYSLSLSLQLWEARGITHSSQILLGRGNREAQDEWMARLCHVMSSDEWSGLKGRQVRGPHRRLWVCCYFSLKHIPKKFPKFPLAFALISDTIWAYFFQIYHPFSHFLKCFSAGYFPQSYLPLFTPALFGSSFLHLLLFSLCPLTSLLACFPWLSTAVALSAKPLFSSTLLYKLAGCLSQAPAPLMPPDVSGRCLSPGQRAGSAGSFDSGHSTSTWMRGFLCAHLLIHAAVMRAH